jgi:hypothetical protein
MESDVPLNFFNGGVKSYKNYNKIIMKFTSIVLLFASVSAIRVNEDPAAAIEKAAAGEASATEAKDADW